MATQGSKLHAPPLRRFRPKEFERAAKAVVDSMMSPIQASVAALAIGKSLPTSNMHWRNTAKPLHEPRSIVSKKTHLELGGGAQSSNSWNLSTKSTQSSAAADMGLNEHIEQEALRKTATRTRIRVQYGDHGRAAANDR